jgi:hypothetical protein
MRKFFSFALLFGALTGFSSRSVLAQTAAPAQKSGAPKVVHEGHDHEGHDHEEHGPHDGELLEVGKGEYHVELCVDDKKNEVVVYLMDKEAKGYIAIDLPFIAVNTKVQGKPVQFKLKAMPQEVDKKGFSSRFALASPELVASIHDKESEARLALKLADKSYNVKLAHDHDHAHEGHDHAEHKHSKK